MATTNKKRRLKYQKGFVLPVLLSFIIAFVAGYGVSAYVPVSTLSSQLTGNKQTTESTSTANKVVLPTDLIKISGCIPFEGEHWVRQSDLPNGPFYVIYNGEVMATEYMFGPKEIPGENYARMPFPEFLAYMQKNNLELKDIVNELQTLDFPMPKADYKYMDLHWTAPHAGSVEPHFDLHFYLKTKEEMQQVCPDSTLQEVLPEMLIQDLVKSGVALPQ